MWVEVARVKIFLGLMGGEIIDLQLIGREPMQELKYEVRRVMKKATLFQNVDESVDDQAIRRRESQGRNGWLNE